MSKSLNNRFLYNNVNSKYLNNIDYNNCNFNCNNDFFKCNEQNYCNVSICKQKCYCITMESQNHNNYDNYYINNTNNELIFKWVSK